MRESILVVGGAGYIGSHTAKLLAKKGYEPIILDDLSTGHRQAAKEFTIHEGNYADVPLVEHILKSRKIKAVMHFGAKALVHESVTDPLLYYANNVGGTINLLRAMRAAGACDLIFSSTCATFGVPTRTPIDETMPQSPINPYGQSKLFVEKILQDAAKAYGMRSAILRYFNAAGADPDGELGEDHREETHLIPRALLAALGRDAKFVVNGLDYPTPDGSCVRDFVHVNDLAAAHIAALKFIRERDKSVDFNLGSESGYSVLEVLARIERVTGVKVKYETGARRIGDPPVLIADSTRAREELGWTCEYSIDQIIETAYLWLKAHPKGFEE